MTPACRAVSRRYVAVTVSSPEASWTWMKWTIASAARARCPPLGDQFLVQAVELVVAAAHRVFPLPLDHGGLESEVGVSPLYSNSLGGSVPS